MTYPDCPECKGCGGVFDELAWKHKGEATQCACPTCRDRELAEQDPSLEDIPKINQITDFEAAFGLALELLRVAKCPNCDGSGVIQIQGSEGHEVSREMAIDAGDPTLEGSRIGGSDFEIEPCQWCECRKELLEGKPVPF